MPKNEEKSRRPREMIHDAQARAYQLHYLVLQAHQGVTDVDRERLRREFHTAVMNYWKQLERFSHNSHAKQFWDNQVIFERGGQGVTLRDLGRLRLRTTTEHVETESPDTGPTVETRQQPVTMTEAESIEVLTALDRVANALEFDASAKNERPRYGAVEADEEDGVYVPEA